MKHTWLDRAISWMSPQRGLKRTQARKLAEILAYEGARGGRRTENWITTSSSADTEVMATVATLRNRARDLVRNNPYAARALDVKVSNTIGVGIVAEVRTKALASFWDAFVDECDADQHCDFNGLQALIERTRSESGEALIRFLPADSSNRVPIQLRVLEPDYLDISRDGTAPNGRDMVRNGIQYDPNGRVFGYWLFDEHPGNTGTWRSRTSYQSFFVPSIDVIHVFRKLRAGQTRGVTDFAPIMMRAQGLDDYDDAEIVRKRTEACLAAMVTSPAGATAARLGPVSTDDDGRIETLSPGMVEYLQPGESVLFTEPKTSGGYADFERFGLRAIAAGYGVPYELMSGDLSQVNYSSYRAGLVDFRRRVEQDQWHIFVSRVCRRVWDRFEDEVSVIRGQRRKVFPEWSPPRFELIDPLKETQADVEACLAGFDTWDEIVRRRGWTAQEQLDAIERWQKELKRRDIVLKTDFRNPQTGGTQSAGDADDNAAAA